MNAKSLILLFLMGTTAEAHPYLYPQIRYQDASSSALGGATLPVTDSVMGNLMNNPAALSKFYGLQAEYFNLHLDSNSASLSNIGTSTISQTNLTSFAKTLNDHPNTQFGIGAGYSSAFSWKGLGVGLLVQEKVRAVSDGTTIYYDTISQTIPTLGIGVPLARGVVRLGYSFQYVNQTSGSGSTSATAGPYGYKLGVKEGHAFSNNASVNFVFPFTYLPTVSLMARNIFGLRYFSGSLFKRAQSPSGVPDEEPMTIDAALNFVLRITGTMKTNWYFQFKDAMRVVNLPILERISVGTELVFSENFVLRGGINGLQFSTGLGYRTSGQNANEINFAWYHDKSPLPKGDSFDTRWVLQYVLKFKDKKEHNRTKEK